MFTGIVTDIGRIRSVQARGAGGDRRLVIETRHDTAALALGASIACSGPCLTVVDKGPGWFAVDVSRETMSKTTIGRWAAETPVNLERALRVGDELGGHLVTGHVDGVGEIVARGRDGDSIRLSTAAPEGLSRFIAPKGAITIDGVSLTVNEVEDAVFGVNIVPHTQTETTLGALAVGVSVNLEIDVIARYVARLHATA